MKTKILLILRTISLPILLLALLLLTPAIAHGENQIAPIAGKSWRYNAGFLQGVSGVQLKGTHTQEFMAGYVNGTKIYWSNRGYVATT